VELISARHPDLPSLSPNGPSWLDASPVSSDGRFIAFLSGADNLVPNDTNGCPNVFVRDMLYSAALIAVPTAARQWIVFLSSCIVLSLAFDIPLDFSQYSL
jgi:hypothetical protein